MLSQEMPVKRDGFTTTVPDAGHEFLRGAYGEYRLRADARHGSYRLFFNGLTCGTFGVDDVRYPVRLRLSTEPFPRETFLSLRAGRMRASADENEYRWLPGSWGVYLSGRPLDIDVDEIDTRVVSLPGSVLARAASVIGGDGPVRFTGWAPVSADRHRMWDQTVRFVQGQLATEDSPLAEPLVRQQMLDMLAATALVTFPNTTMSHVYEPGPGQVGETSLRRALAFVEANADRPITVTDIAEAAGTTARAVQYAFHHHLGTTPMLHLRQIRLERARQELTAADPTTGVTVRQIAARWGFADPGDFAALYRRTYGDAPSRTLRG
ncbi:AraC family transcriptional regulator [Streptomyces sp. NPDC090303]|uniref:AraC family transcriptional regulator n=1 Tax=Streptomyces sp. NPDC090303 TaxID=3365960 RepID=UPI0038185D36